MRALERVLSVPPIPRVVPARVFDAFDWCASDTLTWRRPADRWDPECPIDGSDPARMVFVMHEPLDFLPHELARLHAFGMDLGEARALAPYAIDDATDGLFERRMAARDVFFLAADNLNALFFGLHDWAHFHSHGPFTERAWTERQCDAAAMVWLRMNAVVDDARWSRLEDEVARLDRGRFEREGLEVPQLPDWNALSAPGDRGAGRVAAPPATRRDHT